MRIIDKNKDYYDYLQFQWGQPDKSRTYDRRGSKIITNDLLLRNSTRHKDDQEQLMSGNKERYSLCLLEAGNKQFVFTIQNFTWESLGIIFTFDGEFTLRREINTYTHYNNAAPLSIKIFPNLFEYYYIWKGKRNKRNFKYIDPEDNTYPDWGDECRIFNNPILRETSIPSIIPPEKIIEGLDLYFSSLYEDKTVNINLTDKQKAINHGFEPEYQAFRPNIKK
jgi:hypothetical protein